MLLIAMLSHDVAICQMMIFLFGIVADCLGNRCAAIPGFISDTNMKKSETEIKDTPKYLDLKL